MTDYRFYVGVDWATEQHQACVMNSQGEVLAQCKRSRVAVTNGGDRRGCSFRTGGFSARDWARRRRLDGGGL